MSLYTLFNNMLSTKDRKSQLLNYWNRKFRNPGQHFAVTLRLSQLWAPTANRSSPENGLERTALFHNGSLCFLRAAWATEEKEPRQVQVMQWQGKWVQLGSRWRGRNRRWCCCLSSQSGGRGVKYSLSFFQVLFVTKNRIKASVIAWNWQKKEMPFYVYVGFLNVTNVLPWNCF